MKQILFLSNNSIGSGLSGGDNILIQLMKGWHDRANVILVGSEEARSMAALRGASHITTVISDTRNNSAGCYTIPGLFLHFIRRTRVGLRILRERRDLADAADVVYSASDAYADFVPALKLKRRRKEVLWIACFYLFAPNPFAKDSPYRGRHWLRGALYWLMQRWSYHVINREADVVFVTSEPDVKHFVTASRNASSVVVIRGGVDIEPSESYLQSGKVLPLESRRYDACFIGRFHFQKGVLELIDIWRKVMDKRPNARLAMIGDGPLDHDVRTLIRTHGLERNVDILGFLDGEKKFEVFRQSRLVVHPATYDSGGMAAAEAMAWGLPGVSFDLEALKTYYPKGMIKTLPGENRQFAENILSLLDDAGLYKKTAMEAHQLIVEEWDWRKRADAIYQQVFGAGTAVPAHEEDGK